MGTVHDLSFEHNGELDWARLVIKEAFEGEANGVEYLRYIKEEDAHVYSFNYQNKKFHTSFSTKGKCVYEVKEGARVPIGEKETEMTHALIVSSMELDRHYRLEKARLKKS